MKTIYYLGDQLDKVWNEGSVAEVEITLTTLGREELTITGFTGDLLEKVYFYVPTKDTNNDEVPEYEWKEPNQNPLEKEWNFGDLDDGSANTGVEIKFPYVLNDEKPTLKVKLRLIIGKSESLPSHVYVETLELGDTSAILIFRSGINPTEPVFKPNLTFMVDSLSTDYPGTLTPVKYETNTSNIGTFEIKNIGGENGVITSIEFRDLWWEVKDYMYFTGDTNGNDTATISNGGLEKFTIDVDARSEISDNSDDHYGQTNKFFDDVPSLSEDNEGYLKVHGYINVIYNDGDGGSTNTSIPIELKLDAPIIGYEFSENYKDEDQELKFNYKYSKINHKVLNKKLTIYNQGKSNLVISDIDTNFSIDGVNSAISSTTVGNITILPGASYDFTFDITNLTSLPREIDSSGSYLTTTEDYNKEFARNLIISSNAMNYSNLGTNANRTLAYENNSAINNKEFISSIYYDYLNTQPYMWTILNIESFVPPTLKPLYDSIAKIDIFNNDVYDTATIPSDDFKIEIVEHGAELGTIAWLNSDKYTEQAPSSQPLFVYSPDLHEQFYSNVDDTATWLTVRLPQQADLDRYYPGEPEVVTNPKLEGHVRRKYDFIKDVNPLKVLITKVTKNSPNSGIDTTGTVDPKDQTTTYYDTNEKLLLFLYARGRILTWDSYGVLNYNNKKLPSFHSSNTDNFAHRKEGIEDVNSYGLFNYSPPKSEVINQIVRQTIIEKKGYGLFNYNYSDVANLKGTIDGKLMGVSQEGVTHSYGLFNYNYKSDVINITDIEQYKPDEKTKNSYSIFNYNFRNKIFPDVNRYDNYTKINKKHNPIPKYSYAVLNYNSSPSEVSFLTNWGVKKNVNQTPRYSYGLFNYNYKNDTIDTIDVQQYRPENQIRYGYSLLNYSTKSDIGMGKGTSWGGSSSSGLPLGISQFTDPSSVTLYANSLLNYSIKNNYAIEKKDVKQYDPTKVDRRAYGLFNFYNEDIFQDESEVGLDWINSKKIPVDVSSYGVFNLNPEDNFVFSWGKVEQAKPVFNVITTDGTLAGSTTNNPGHTISAGELQLRIQDWDNFSTVSSNHLWKPSWPENLSMELFNNGNLNLTINAIIVEHNSPKRIVKLQVGNDYVVDDPFPITIVAKDSIYSYFQLYVDEQPGQGVEDGYLTQNSANEVDDWYDTNGTMYSPTIKIYTNDPHPDPSDSKHVIIDDATSIYDGMAEWTIELGWSTNWADDPSSSQPG